MFPLQRQCWQGRWCILELGCSWLCTSVCTVCTTHVTIWVASATVEENCRRGLEVSADRWNALLHSGPSGVRLVLRLASRRGLSYNSPTWRWLVQVPAGHCGYIFYYRFLANGWYMPAEMRECFAMLYCSRCHCCIRQTAFRCVICTCVCMCA